MQRRGSTPCSSCSAAEAAAVAAALAAAAATVLAASVRFASEIIRAVVLGLSVTLQREGVLRLRLAVSVNTSQSTHDIDRRDGADE